MISGYEGEFVNDHELLPLHRVVRAFAVNIAE